MHYLSPFLIVLLFILILLPLVRVFIYVLPFFILAYFVYWLIKHLAKFFNSAEDDELEINMSSSDVESTNIKDALGDVTEVKDAEFSEED